MEFPPEYPEVLQSAANAAHAELLAHQVAADQAQIIALAVAERIRRDLGGTTLYISKAVRTELSIRDREIVSKLAKGIPYQVLAKEFELTEMRIRQIETEHHAIERARRQQALF